MLKFTPLSLLFFFAFVCNLSIAQRRTVSQAKDTISGNAFVNMIDQSFSMYVNELLPDDKTDSIIDALGYEASTSPLFTDEEYCLRLNQLNERSSFKYDCNEVTLSSIRFFAANRRSFAKIVLGRSKIYFDLFEEKLTEYDLPIELKYLSVIESGLRPQVKSHAGACGLWQFMYATGKSYGLTENSYIDERMDPLKATDAACRFLKKLYSIYGDWNLALAAYNAGPGNVNKAIKRSGGKRTYWEIRPFLPKETQGYVPNFISASYLLTFHAVHNIIAADAKIHYFQLDTMCLNRSVHMQTIENLVGWNMDEIQVLNPVYKTTYIPSTSPRQCITGPLDKIGLLVSLEDSLYALETNVYGPGGNQVISKPPAVNTSTPDLISSGVTKEPNPENENAPVQTVLSTVKYTYHKVKAGESLGKIASQYGVSIQDIQTWNSLTDTRIQVGQLIKIQTKITTTIQNQVPERQVNKDPQDSTNVEGNPNGSTPVIETPVIENKPKPEEPKVRKQFYTVRRGDTFNKIAGKYGLTLGQLQKLNPGVSANRIQPGQRIRVK
jgi:membrane-bound lytic murein transglycosylase D